MKGKYSDKMTRAINAFWMNKHYPPTLRDLMKSCGITSTSVASYVVRRLPGIRIANHGRIIPEWVDKALTAKE